MRLGIGTTLLAAMLICHFLSQWTYLIGLYNIARIWIRDLHS